ncbi:porin family protein [Rhizobium sp. P32RR-XVIII]|uniref:outer membrane protein n=1 Tax=Rhizobium sp. P32RR-XVIII TaxID=2726738 RepID=UPI0014573D06|nr:outer membrane beta-barrel protein [Rhizobium sp. P32RR-XVIII]NLS06227.1 porin family protein [Rhizobium sp. P32RR-XVIII]
MDNIVIGFEGDLYRNWNEEDFGVPASVETTAQGSVPGRPGFALERALFYGMAGWTAARAEAHTPGSTSSDTLSGYTVGAGVDYAFTNNVFARENIASMTSAPETLVADQWTLISTSTCSRWASA